jgi:hypothetical protein
VGGGPHSFVVGGGPRLFIMGGAPFVRHGGPCSSVVGGAPSFVVVVPLIRQCVVLPSIIVDGAPLAPVIHPASSGLQGWGRVLGCG